MAGEGKPCTEDENEDDRPLVAEKGRHCEGDKRIEMTPSASVEPASGVI